MGIAFEALQDQQVQVLNFVRSQEDQGCALHIHEQLEFYYVEQGGICITTGGKEYWLKSKDIGFINWCQPHRGMAFLADTRYKVIKVRVNPTMLNKLIPFNHQLPVIYEKDTRLMSYLDQIIEESQEEKPFKEEALSSVIDLIVIYLLRQLDDPQRPEGCHDQDIQKILQYICMHYKDVIHLDALAGHLNISKSYMCRLFKEATGKTLITYINRLKCAYAVLLMKEKNSLIEVSQEVGFSDYNYFARVFKSCYGIAPREYRKNQ